MPEKDTAARRGPAGWLARHNPLHWIKRHKKLTIVLVVLLAVVAFIVSSCMRTASDVEKQIESAQESYRDSVEQAQTTYDQSVEDQATNLAQAQKDLDKAQQD